MNEKDAIETGVKVAGVTVSGGALALLWRSFSIGYKTGIKVKGLEDRVETMEKEHAAIKETVDKIDTFYLKKEEEHASIKEKVDKIDSSYLRKEDFKEFRMDCRSGLKEELQNLRREMAGMREDADKREDKTEQSIIRLHDKLDEWIREERTRGG